jgi:hypothetical protein
LSADAAFVEIDNKKKISITNIALPAEHERLLSIDSSFPHLVRIAPRYKLDFDSESRPILAHNATPFTNAK